MKNIIKLFAGALLLIAALTFLDVKAYKGNKEETSKIIVIDAGHGGTDPGKISREGILEKDINLQIANKLKAELEVRGYSVYMTRTEDRCLAESTATNKKRSDMNKRVEIINNSGADYLISIHQNSYSDPSVKGAQVFYYGMSEEGEGLANAIQNNMKEIDNENTRKIKAGNDYFILRRSSCPGVIVECGFLSSPEETARLIDETYQQKLADAIADAVDEVSK